MPGSQRFKKDVGGGYSVIATVKSRSRWRFLPILGPALTYTLGRRVSFRIGVRLIKGSDELGQSLLDVGVDEDVWLEIDGDSIGSTALRFTLVELLSNKDKMVKVDTPDFFLTRTGHGELRIGIPSPDQSVYTFEIWEPAISAINWLVAILAGSLGAAITILLAWLF